MPFSHMPNAFSILYHTFRCDCKSSTILLTFFGQSLLDGHNAGIHQSDDVCSSIMFWTACMRVIASRDFDVIWSWVRVSCGDEHDQLKWNSWTVSKFDHETTEFCSVALEASKRGVFIARFVYLLRRCYRLAGTDSPKPCSQVNQVVNNVTNMIFRPLVKHPFTM